MDGLPTKRKAASLPMSAHRPVVSKKPKTEADYTRTLNPQQAEAFRTLVASNKHGLLVGGPGTGKTYVLLQLIQYYLDHNWCVIVCAPLARVLNMMRSLPNNRAYRVHTVQGFVRKNNFPEGYNPSFPDEKFLRCVKANVSMVSPRGKGGDITPCVGMMSECFAASAEMLDYWVMCLRALKTCMLTKIILEGDPTQCEAIGTPTSKSKFFGPAGTMKDLILVALHQSMRFGPELGKIIKGLRDYRQPVPQSVMMSLYTLAIQRKHACEADMVLCTRHEIADKGRRSQIKKYSHWMEIHPAGANKQKHNVRYVAVGAVVRITRNMYLEQSEWHNADTDSNVDMQDRSKFIANGDLATVVRWPNCKHSGKHGAFKCIEADDPHVGFITLKLYDQDETIIDLTPTKTNRQIQFEVNLASHATTHSQQGQTVKELAVDCRNAIRGDYRTIAMVALSRMRNLKSLKFFLVDDPYALGQGGPSNQSHKDMCKIALDAEEAVKRKYER